MITFYLDTSTINWLFDDSSCLELIKKLPNHAKIYISVFTVAELAATSHRKRRIGLLSLAKDVLGDCRPLAMPDDLLKRSLKAMQTWAKEISGFMGSEWDRLWDALCDPQLIDTEGYFEVIEWKRQQEIRYQDMQDQARPFIQKAIDKLPATEKNALRSQFSKLIRHFTRQQDFVNDIIRDFASRGFSVIITKELAQRVIDHSEHWRFFLASMAYGLYIRSVQMSHFSKKINPGSIDTQQAIYLAMCDIFVTADQRQHRMMRMLIPFGHVKIRIWSYDQFKHWIVNVASNG